MASVHASGTPPCLLSLFRAILAVSRYYLCDRIMLSYQTLVNERNDLLHGSVVIEKLRFRRSVLLGHNADIKGVLILWQRPLQIQMDSVVLQSVK